VTGKVNETTEKLLAFLLAGLFLMFIGYVITSYFGATPQPMTDVASWLNDNTVILTIAFCFLVGCYVILKLKRRNDYSPGG
jgi:uncharacterized membrane protein YhdT